LALRRSLILRGFGTPKPLVLSDGGGNLADAMAAKNPPRPISTINYFNKTGGISPVRKAGLG
ncbi:MAG: hypothetical protein WBC87_24715, partial [Pseudolabrys sp.]